jgi:hypothetical protein
MRINFFTMTLRNTIFSHAVVPAVIRIDRIRKKSHTEKCSYSNASRRQQLLPANTDYLVYAGIRCFTGIRTAFFASRAQVAKCDKHHYYVSYPLNNLYCHVHGPIGHRRGEANVVCLDSGDLLKYHLVSPHSSRRIIMSYLFSAKPCSIYSNINI